MHFCFSLLFLTLILAFVNEVVAQGVNLGKLHWCGSLCLCDDETNSEMHCFNERQIYSLIDLSPRKIIKLEKINFQLDDKVMWCTEVCLCHKEGKKEFKCTTRQQLEVFINENAPHLSKYLEPEVEIYDMRDLINAHDDLETGIAGFDVEGGEEAEAGAEAEAEEESHASKTRHDKKKNRKHRKNKKKHHDKKDSTEQMEETASTLALPSTAETVTEPEREVLAANIFPQVDTNESQMKPSSTPAVLRETPMLEHPQERKTVTAEMSEDFKDVQKVIEDIKDDVALNQQILLVTVAVASLAMIGVIILFVYVCCIRRPRKGSLKSPRNNGLHQEEKGAGKVNLDEAW
ncbi:UNVERIFIED_CONTAM: hypothetical protein RMT77_016865 [Armadillidium vulgare]